MVNTNSRVPSLVYAAFLVGILIGGTNFVAVRFSNRELPPFWGSSIRFFAAGALLAAFALTRRLEFPRGRALAGAAAFGVIGIGAFYAFAYWGLQRASAGLAAVTIALSPLLTFALAVAHGQESFRWRPLAGAVVGVAGIAVIFRGSVGEAVPVLSVLALIAAAASAAEASIIMKWFPKSNPVTTNVVALITGAVVLLILSLLTGEPRSWPVQASTWAALTYLVILGSSVLFVIFLFVLRFWPASSVSYQFVLLPLVTVIVSMLLEGTSLEPTLIGGMVLVMAGVYVGIALPEAPVQTAQRLGTEPCLNCPE
jgi:drug/metabolite transporter (DMT)-like permease